MGSPLVSYGETQHENHSEIWRRNWRGP
jgi:hypothetical protein